MKNALIIPIFNRPQYVRQCFESLSKLTTKPDIVVLVDDCSTDMNIPVLCRSYEGATVIRHERNKGVKGALQTGIEEAIRQGAEILINLDSDAVVADNFIFKMLLLKARFLKSIVSGFNNVSKVNPVVSEGEWFYQKNYLNGINMSFSKQQYYDIVRPALQSEGNWDYNLSVSSKPFYVTKPSCVQHIGMESSMGHSGNGQKPDTAQDFKSLHLPDVTLFGIDAHNPQGIERAAEISQRDIQFGAMKVITQRLFPGKTLDEGRRNYSKFMIKNLHEHFNTSHVLTIHADGYVVNWKAWDNQWLQYDYIGATWGYKDNMNVGNGGFSLRSKKLCEILAKLHIEQHHPEDDVICRKLRPMLERDYGIKFAPEEVANKFSIEGYGANCFPKGNYYAGSFGFHSKCVNFSESEIPKELWL